MPTKMYQKEKLYDPRAKFEYNVNQDLEWQYEEALCERLFCILGYLIYCNRTHRFAFPIRFKCTKPKWNENNQIYCAQFIVNVIIFCQAKSFLVDDVILHFIAIMVIAISQNMILS